MLPAKAQAVPAHSAVVAKGTEQVSHFTPWEARMDVYPEMFWRLGSVQQWVSFPQGAVINAFTINDGCERSA